jgi:hypothetical protein
MIAAPTTATLMLPESAIPECTPPHSGRLVAKISGFDGYVQSAARSHQNSRSRKVRPFDLTGRPMKGWLSLGPDGYADDRDLVRWVERGVTYARSVPAK